MRRLIACVAVTLVAAGCRGDHAPVTVEPVSDRLVLQPLPAPSPFTQVTAGPVQALVPSRWDSQLLGDGATFSSGLIASPRLDDWKRMDGSVQGMAAVWLDVASVGIPSDYYYLAASGPVLHRLTGGEGCHRSFHKIVVDHRPAFGSAVSTMSSGDFVARGSGTCTQGHGATRWAYFVAAPGVGPVRQVGIPNSGLYVVVAVIRDDPDAAQQLRSMLLSARFGNASVGDLLAAARLSAQQV